MKRILSLHQRLGLGLVGLSLSIVVGFTALLWVSFNWLESDLLDRILGSQLDVYVESNVSPTRTEALRAGLLYYRPSQATTSLPDELARLAPGSYRDLALAEQRYHVLVREIQTGDRAYLLYNVKDFAQLEQHTHLALVMGLVLCAGLVLLVSGAVTRRALRPLQHLVNAITRLPLDQPGARLSHHPVEGELGVIVDALNLRLAEIEALVTRERAFSRAAAHELRTPLAIIGNASELAQLVPEAANEAHARIQRAQRRASETLDALLALSSSQHQSEGEWVDVAELLQQWAEPHLQESGIAAGAVHWQLARVQRCLPASVLGIIFSNVLRNALRAAPQGPIWITLDEHAVSLRDAGPGIAPELLAHVFEPGIQGQHGGTGMGLYIAKTLAERQGWQLSIESEVGQGTCVRLAF